MYSEIFGSDNYQKLQQYCENLISWNRKISLTSIPDDKIFEKLIAPSAWLGLQYSKEDIGLVADFGCGPGIPGVPMAIVDQKNRYLLLDSTQKKIKVAKNSLAIPGLVGKTEVEAKAIRIERKTDIGKVDRLVSRAAGDMTSVAKLWKNKVKRGGIADFFKGNDVDVEIKELLSNFPGVSVKKLEVPTWFDGLIIVRIRGLF